MTKGFLFYVRSLTCSAWFRFRGCQSSLVGCDGSLPSVELKGNGSVKIGTRFVVRGRVARCEIAVGENGHIRIGDRVFLNQGVVIACTESIEIGDDSLIGDFCAIYDSNYHQIDPHHVDKPRPVVIGKNVWLGNGVLVLPGSSVGDHTVVAARSVVRGHLPPRVLAAGNPATVVRELDIPDGWVRS